MENYIEVLKEAHRQLTCDDKSISVKDLTFCKRKKVFSVIDPIPMSNEELYNIITGQAIHDVIERLFMVYPNRFRTEMEIRYENVKGRIDAYDKYFDIVVDVKATKGQQVLLKPMKQDEQQIKYYMSMKDTEEGQIIYHMVNFPGRYQYFSICMSFEQRQEQLQKLSSEAKNLQSAIKSGDPSLVKGIYDDDEMNWLCNKCPYLNQCKEIRSLDEQHHIATRRNVSNQTDINNGNGKGINIGQNTSISQLLNPGMKDLIIEGRIDSISEPRTVDTKTGGTAQVADAIISDETGSIKLSLWDSQINSIRVGDNLTIGKGYTKKYGGEITLNVWKNGTLTKY